jgi:hypothetical protein
VAGDPWFEGKGFSKISDELIEAFLNDAYREEILLAFNAPEKRVDLCRWFSENGLTIYRRLIHPNSADPILEEAVFPPKLDFKPYHDATGSNQ